MKARSTDRENELISRQGPIALRRHDAAIGEFIRHWAAVEALLFRVLFQYSGVPREMVNALLGPRVHVKTVIECLTRVSFVVNASDRRAADLKFLLDQITVIASIRNLIVHNGDLGYSTYLDESGKLHLSQQINNEFRVWDAAEVAWQTIDAPLFHSAAADLRRIYQALLAHMQLCDSTRDSNFNACLGSGDKSTWLCKPPRPQKRTGNRPASSQARPARRGSSPKSQRKVG